MFPARGLDQNVRKLVLESKYLLVTLRLSLTFTEFVTIYVNNCVDLILFTLFLLLNITDGTWLHTTNLLKFQVRCAQPAAAHV